jgi:hypothetical protein
MSAFGLRRRRRPVNVWGLDTYVPNDPNYSGEFTGFQPAKETMKKYYVGARHIGQSIQHGSNADCTRETLDDAIADAKQQIRGGADTVVVVKIVAIVRRDHPPISVETVD